MRSPRLFYFGISCVNNFLPGARQNCPPATLPRRQPGSGAPIPAPSAAPKPMVVAGHLYHRPNSAILIVTVLEGTDLFGERPRPAGDGMISVALLGDVQASGLTPLQLADQIATKLKKFVQDP